LKSLLLVDDRSDLLAKVEPILKHWGYQVAHATDVARANILLHESVPAMVLIGTHLLANPALKLPTPAPMLLALSHPAAAPSDQGETPTLDVPVDIFELFSQIQSRIETPPRKNLRLRLRLPGMYRQGKAGYVVAELLSLSLGGLFFRSPLRVKEGAKLNAIFPLLGHGKELEVTGTVLYLVDPSPHNNYTQGFGLGFSELTDEQQDHLRRYIEENFFEQLAASTSGNTLLP